MDKESKLDFYQKSYIINELYQYYKNKNDIEEMENEILESSPLPPDGQPRGNEVGNPTEGKAIRIINKKSTRRYLTLHRNIDAIDRARARLNESEIEIVDYIFKEGKTQIYCLMHHHIGKDTYYNARNKLIKLVALELGEI